MKNDLVAIGSVFVVLGTLVASQAFGHVEARMLISRLKSMFFSRGGTHEVSFQLQGTRDWDLVWQALVEYAENNQLVEIRLDINFAAAQEGYHASWRRPCNSEKRERWQTVLPLFSDNHVVGRLVVFGRNMPGVSSCDAMSQAIDFLEPIEAEVLKLASRQQVQPSDEQLSQEQLSDVEQDLSSEVPA